MTYVSTTKTISNGTTTADPARKRHLASSRTTLTALAFAMLGLLTTGCGAEPATPFDTMKSSTVTAYRLQNFEQAPAAPVAAAPVPGAPVAAAPAAVPGLPAIPGLTLPPEVQTWLQQGAAGLGAQIPQGALPPGVLQPGVTATAPPMAPPEQPVPRFNNFRIIGGQGSQVVDPKVLEELGLLLGNPDSYADGPGGCGTKMYPEMGISFPGAPGQPPNDMLISFACHKAWFSFAWASKGRSAMTPDTVSKLTALVQKIWPS